MASRNDQAVPANNTKNKGILAASGGTLDVTTLSKARTLSAVLSTPPSTLPNEQEHPRHEPVITLALLKAPREESSRRYSESLTFDVDSSSLCPVAMQVMTTGTTSIEEQLAQISEAIARLTRNVEENDLQIAMLVNRLEVQHDNKADLKVVPPKEETNEKEEPLVEKAE
ncbi:hypothetical protein ACFX2F_027760 [Malus domestica]